MRENRKLNTKRRSQKASVWKTLHASVKQKKQRAAAIANSEGMEFQSDVPNLSISRALIVLLVLHIVAIGGMYVHNKWFAETGQQPVVAAPENPNKPAELPKETEVAKVEPVAVTPVVNTGYELYVVASNDTYESIAGAREVDSFELRRINSNRELRSGSVLRIPAKMVKPVVAAPAVEVEEPAQIAAASAQPNPRPNAELAAVAANIAPPVAEIVEEEIPKAVIVPEPALAAPTYDTYKIREKDTFWRISKKFNVKLNALVAANKGVNPSKLKIGQSIRIPR